MNDLLADLLTAYGFQPIQATAGRQALAILAREKPSAILLDLMLPDLSGFEICRQLKTSRETRKIPILILTALDRPIDRRYGFETGADDYLTKPFTPESLVERLRTCVDRFAQTCRECAHLVLTVELSASVNDLKAFNALVTCLYCQTDLPSDEIEALRSGLVSLADAARRWAAAHRGASPVRLTIDLDASRLRLAFRPACEGAEAFLAEHLDPEAVVPSAFTDAGIIDRMTTVNGDVLFEKTLPPPPPGAPAAGTHSG